jgi:two-component system CheB/CheR fusion protein
MNDRREKTQGTALAIVGIGASAGGLDAFEAFFEHAPPNSGLTFVLVQHLSADRQSILSDLVDRFTCMPVSEVEDGMALQADHVYVIPPGRDLALLNERLHLMEPPQPPDLRLSIDYFFRSLAQDQGERAIGVILSGTGSDGTVGLRAIKEAGGMAMVQDPQTAAYDGMPRSAIETGLVDYVLPPEEMPRHLISYTEHAFGPPEKRVSVPVPAISGALERILILLRDQMGHDFSHYKKNTIHRRIERRMAVTQIGELDAYVRHLEENADEVEQLFRGLLISVTNFFRNPEVFQALEEQVIPCLLERPAGEPIRAWVAGCATGEEAYSIAILLREGMERVKKRFEVQIFATDIDSEAIETARAGVYPEGIAVDVSPERLERFFAQQDSAYRVDTTIRDMVIFAEQNVVGDPPFSNVDLISCRNLLIYLEPDLQKKTLPLFHYALRPGGFLLLGTAEGIGKFSNLFDVVDGSHRIFQHRESPVGLGPFIDFPAPSRLRPPASRTPPEKVEAGEEVGMQEVTERLLLRHYAPPSAIVNEEGEVLYFHGRTGDYLEPAPGEATHKIEKMARQGLRLALTTAIRRARTRGEPVHYRGVEVRTNNDYRTVDLTVRPLMEPPSMQGLLIVAFESVDPGGTVEDSGEADAAVQDEDRCVSELERELRAKEERLQTIIEEIETSNEELKSTNEELQSSNEELQSANEELETSRQELQSVNEELRTANAELEEQYHELQQANDDIKNMLSGTGVGTVFVDQQLRVRRFTPDATEVLHLIEGDVGRPLDHVSTRLVDYDELAEDAEAVLDTLEPREREGQTEDGDWYLVRMLPYRTRRNVIGGVVITFVDLTSLREAREEIADLRDAEREVRAARDYAQSTWTRSASPC